MAITVQQEKVKDTNIALDLMMAGYEEEIPLAYPLRPNWAVYKAIEDRGEFFLFTVRDDAKLVGFFGLILSENLNCAGELTAVGTSLYLAPAYRGTRVGLELIARGEQAMVEHGAKCILLSSQISKPIDKLLQRRGYAATETIFARRT